LASDVCRVPSTSPLLVVVLNVHQDGETDLLHIAQAARLPCLLTSSGEHREEDRRKNGDDGDDNQQLDKGKTLTSCGQSTTSYDCWLSLSPEGGSTKSEGHSSSADAASLHVPEAVRIAPSVADQLSPLGPLRVTIHPRDITSVVVPNVDPARVRAATAAVPGATARPVNLPMTVAVRAPGRRVHVVEARVAAVDPLAVGEVHRFSRLGDIRHEAPRVQLCVDPVGTVPIVRRRAIEQLSVHDVRLYDEIPGPASRAERTLTGVSVDQALVVVLGVHRCRCLNLLEVREAARLPCLLASSGEHREEDSCEDGDDGDDNQQLNEGEASSASCGQDDHLLRLLA